MGITIDTGHSFVGGENVAESVVLAKRAGDLLYHMHFNDNHGYWDDDMIVSSVHLTCYVDLLLVEKTGYKVGFQWISTLIVKMQSVQFPKAFIGLKICANC